MSPTDNISGNSAPPAQPTADPAWSCEEIERLYRQALEAVEAVADDLSAVEQSLSTDPQAEADGRAGSNDEGASSSDEGASNETAASSDERQTLRFPGPLTGPAAAKDADAGGHGSSAPNDDDTRLDPLQVIEAFLFVGGQPLSAQAICGLLHGEFDADFVAEAIEGINRGYARQNRPYEIRLATGGYSMALRPEYEPLRNRAYGAGPRQVRLSQETLEVLALVAYRQPITRAKVEEVARRSVGPALRQLVERGLLGVDRPLGAPLSDAEYRTSPRFLQLFGLARLDDLPQIEDLEFK